VFLTERNLADKTILEQRLLIDIYKSGNTLGDPVHEPGPGDSPLNSGDAHGLKAPAAPQVQPQPAAPRTGALEKRQPAAPGGELPAAAASPAGPLSKAAPAHANAEKPKNSVSRSAIRYPTIGAAVVAMGGLGAQSVQKPWSSRIEQALGGGRSNSLSRVARLSRLLRKSKS
jgi:hypothetical protein